MVYASSLIVGDGVCVRAGGLVIADHCMCEHWLAGGRWLQTGIMGRVHLGQRSGSRLSAQRAQR